MSPKRKSRITIEDLWRKRDGSPTQRDGQGLRWRVTVVDCGHRNTKAFARKVDAEAYEKTKAVELHTGSYVPEKAGQILVSTIYERWRESQGHISVKTELTRSSVWNQHVQPEWATEEVGDISTARVRSWVAKMKNAETGPTTIENAYGMLRMILGAAVEDRRLGRNPCDGVKLPKRKHTDRGYLSHKQVLLLAAKVGHQPTVVLFLAYTGLRWGEMAALRVQDFDMLRRRVSITRAVTEAKGIVWGNPKDHERRSVPFPADLAADLAALMVGKSRDDLVFTTTEGDLLRVSNYRPRVFAPAVKVCQKLDDTFPTITPHDLRHTAASLAVSAGANVKGVQRMLGHAKASMTLDTYADLFDDDLDAVAGALDINIVAAKKAGAYSVPTGPPESGDKETPISAL